MKTKILTIVILLVSIAMLSTGAFAYFSAARNTNVATIAAGTLDISIASTNGLDTSTAPADSEFASTATPPWNFSNIAPGDSKSGCLWVRNNGTLASVEVRWDFNSLLPTGGTGSVNLADRLQVTYLKTTEPSSWVWPADLLPGGAFYAGGYYDEKSDNRIDLNELSRWSTRTGKGYDWANDNNPFLVVAPGGKGAVCMTVQMMDDALEPGGAGAIDNLYQGASLTYMINVKAFNPATAPK